VKLCKDCRWFIRAVGPFPPYCSGPHVPTDVVYGKRRMQLPSARYSGGQGLASGRMPCGESAARHHELAVKKKLWR